MTPRSPGTNSRLRSPTKAALKRREKLIADYMAKGHSKKDAEALAQKEMRDNAKQDWRRG